MIDFHLLFFAVALRVDRHGVGRHGPYGDNATRSSLLTTRDSRLMRKRDFATSWWTWLLQRKAVAAAYRVPERGVMARQICSRGKRGSLNARSLLAVSGVSKERRLLPLTQTAVDRTLFTGSASTETKAPCNRARGGQFRIAHIIGPSLALFGRLERLVQLAGRGQVGVPDSQRTRVVTISTRNVCLKCENVRAHHWEIG
jgi:hypothetical protein